MSAITVTDLAPGDYEIWRPLFEGYADFYGTVMTDAAADQVWSWLHDSNHLLEGLIARDGDGRAVGIAHVRACPRPLTGATMGFLDDLYVSPDARGSGAADALFEALAERARERGWPVIRLLTQEFNYRGRAFYDRYTGAKSDFIMYQWKVE
jgi:GNAT superfamily N-acetyltransferase